ncbi:hypothetical protein [Halorussus sp. MSC15.2]|uniref:hypothetical protein n=1 Tax=Halorussus sp. MSC15.2 TaxID=2283638 RepID=UPI0013D70924|nr:hypothetical protein [Halorussus sp. MSC15.2]NEU58970.1 hypothetical protein [Halorussus sp. MSC15.2]
MRVRERLGISERGQELVTRAMEAGLVVILLLGLYRGNVGVVVNSAIALAVTFLPAMLERDYDIPMDAGLTLWITTAVFLHALGTIGPYRDPTLWWWDHVTHALSSSLVAAIGYATTRALDEHTDDVYFPPRFTFVFILLFVVAFGVVWEVIEFGVGGLATILGSDKILTQFGLEDTMKDLLFDTVGGVVVAVWGAAYLSDVVGALTDRMDGESPGAE